MGNVTISTSTVAEGFCPSWMIEKWPELVALLTANLNGALNVFNYGSSTPAPADQGKPWLRLNADGTPDRTYSYSGGNWISLHALPAGSVMMYQGTEASIDTFDGGEVAAVTATTGPMWEKVDEMDGRFPIGPGTLPDGSTVVAVNDQGGEQTHTLIMKEMPYHRHDVLAVNDDTDGGGFNRLRNAPTTAAPDAVTGYAGGNPDGTTEPHNNVPQYNAIFFIKRTARAYYRV